MGENSPVLTGRLRIADACAAVNYVGGKGVAPSARRAFGARGYIWAPGSTAFAKSARSPGHSSGKFGVGRDRDDPAREIEPTLIAVLGYFSRWSSTYHGVHDTRYLSQDGAVRQHIERTRE